MPLDHSKATATVVVTGLSFGCFNPETRNWEVALIRHPRHNLTISVIKRAADNTFSKETFELDRDPKLEIHIEANDPVAPADKDVLYMKDPFDRKNPDVSDDEDFRWIVDLEKEFNSNKPINVTRPKFPITPLFVSFPVLYADPDDKLDDMELVDLTRARQAGESSHFGTLAESARADITCQPGGSVVFKVGGPEPATVELPQIDGVTHEIRIENICPEHEGGPAIAAAAPPSDFAIYFSLIQSRSGRKFDLKRKVSGTLGTDAVCNNTYLGSRTSLFPI